MIITLDRVAFNQGKNAKYDISILVGGWHTLSLQEVRELFVTRLKKGKVVMG